MYCVIDFGPEAMYRNIDQWICRLPDITVPTHARVYLPSFVLFLIWRGHLQVMIPCPCPTLLVLPLGVSSSFSSQRASLRADFGDLSTHPYFLISLYIIHKIAFRLLIPPQSNHKCSRAFSSQNFCPWIVATTDRSCFMARNSRYQMPCQVPVSSSPSLIGIVIEAPTSEDFI